MENSTPKAVLDCVDDKTQCKQPDGKPPEFGHFYFATEQSPEWQDT